MSAMKPGDYLKVFLPGEIPWATIVSIHEDGRLAARLDNYPVCTHMHGYKYGDVVTFKKRTGDGWEFWELAPLEQQLPPGPTAVSN